MVKEKRETIEVEVEGRALTLSNQAKVLYPAAGFTMGRWSTTTGASLRCWCRI